jgi:hypothetical protein
MTDQYYAKIARQSEKLRKLMVDCAECEFCGISVLTPEEAEKLFLEVGRWPNSCTGVQYLQEDPFIAEIYDESVEVMMCNGEYMQRKDDI